MVMTCSLPNEAGILCANILIIILKGDKVDNILDLLGNPLVWSFLVGIGLYILAWAGARFFTGVFARPLGNVPNAIEIGATRACRFLIILHLILVIGMAIALSVHDRPNNPDWGYVIWYVLWSLPFLIIDVCVLISLSSHSKVNKKAEQE